MPSVAYSIRLTMVAATLSAAMLTGGCGSKEEVGNATEVQMKDLETVDGTINDAMTDLDGVQSEGTAMAETGNASAPAASPAKDAEKDGSAGSAPDMETEVVADQ